MQRTGSVGIDVAGACDQPAGFFEREGILEHDEDNSYLNLEETYEDSIQQVLGCLVSYRILIGQQQGRKVFTLQTIPAWKEDDRFTWVARVAGFSLHAGVAAQAWERKKLERRFRYISRPSVSDQRISLTSSGNFRYQLKTPYNDGNTHDIFEPPGMLPSAELIQLVHTIAHRVGCYLERIGCFDQYAENDYLIWIPRMTIRSACCRTIRSAIALRWGHAGSKVFALQTLPACDPADTFGDSVDKVACFSLHARVAAKDHERNQPKRLCRCISRPAVSEKRLSLTVIAFFG